MEVNQLIEVLLMLSFCVSGVWYFIHSMRRRERDEVRRMYADLVRERLDVLRTGLAMGLGDKEIAELDQRLEKLVGGEKLLETLRAGRRSKAVADAELASSDLI
ncbi:MAG TPA: hypothetical protein ENO21_00795, partial [Firmicutes bacterium]|nr:hypothetical protein [Bacillota bacterium]